MYTFTSHRVKSSTCLYYKELMSIMFVILLLGDVGARLKASDDSTD